MEFGSALRLYNWIFEIIITMNLGIFIDTNLWISNFK